MIRWALCRDVHLVVRTAQDVIGPANTNRHTTQATTIVANKSAIVPRLEEGSTESQPGDTYLVSGVVRERAEISGEIERT